MKSIIVGAAPYLIAFAFVMAVVTYFVSERFFSALLKAQPDAADALKREHLLVVYGPIAPGKVRYLSSRKFASLADPSLRQLGQQAFSALTAFSVAFVAALLSLLVWGA